MPEDLQEEETLNGGMRIIRTGRGHYSCQSERDLSKWYSVDLLEHEGLGSCTCDDFHYRLLPRWKNVRRPFNSMRCKHISRVRNHCLDQIIAFYLAQQKQKS